MGHCIQVDKNKTERWDTGEIGYYAVAEFGWPLPQEYLGFAAMKELRELYNI